MVRVSMKIHIRPIQSKTLRGLDQKIGRIDVQVFGLDILEL
jgi:hypothetical protein